MMPVLSTDSFVLSEEVINRLKNAEQDWKEKTISEVQYCMKKWAILKKIVDSSITDEVNSVKELFEEGAISEVEYCLRIKDKLKHYDEQYKISQKSFKDEPMEQPVDQCESGGPSDIKTEPNGTADNSCTENSEEELEEQKVNGVELEEQNVNGVELEEQNVNGVVYSASNEDSDSPEINGDSGSMKKRKRDQYISATESKVQNGNMDTNGFSPPCKKVKAEEFPVDGNEEISPNTRLLRSRKNDLAVDSQPQLKKEKEDKIEELPTKCVACRQRLNDPDLRMYLCHPNNAVEECVVLTYPELNLLDEGQESGAMENPQAKITYFRYWVYQFLL